MIRVGFGFDTHQLVAQRKLIIGGVHILYPLGCKGHSDGDVLLHAVCDALLGAANLRDIGCHFPDTDPQYKNIDSVLLLKEVHCLIKKDQWKIENIDSTIVIEQPKISPYMEQIQISLANILNLEKTCISIKAKTSEGLGFIGRKEGVSAYSVALLSK
ncbi:MAG: 2-C-methyl-D-erythritol 2,4-cyclodiphosphate synthase [Bacteroidales bacterium]|jgi:2-C-methyl-D-erythritol 2,4-cyclodiphosphate synthase|nr:2-C-methyl-D-erythritol 2,4-cyclodiphosphate synthase [Bacteroidales bacterium]